MKKTLSLLLCVLLLAAALAGCVPFKNIDGLPAATPEATPESTPDPTIEQPPYGDYAVEWASPSLEQAIRELLNKPSGAITIDELVAVAEITVSSNDDTFEAYYNDGRLWGSLDFSVSGEINAVLSDLKHFKQLTVLWVEGNNIRDISPLGDLTNLTELTLWSGGISDISPLSKLTRLEYLDLSGYFISDISPLGNLTNLTWLSLYGNDINDISPLSGLTNLAVLYLESDGITNEDIMKLHEWLPECEIIIVD